MPRRTREHELETESEIAFRDLIPTTWVIRDVQKDYGIDQEVEVFENGEATGITFKVQLKGTDGDFGGKQPFVKVKSSSISYWLKLDSPVLVVLLCARTKRVYARWAHSYDPHPRKFPKVSTRFKFSPRDRFSANSYLRIEQELAYVRDFRKRAISGRIPVQVRPSSDMPVNADQFNYHLVSLIRDMEGVLTPYSDLDHPSIEIEVSKNEITVVFPARIASMTIHEIGGRYGGEEGSKSLAADALFVIGLVFANVGLPEQAIEVLSVFPWSSLSLKESELGCILAESLIAADRISEALTLLAEIIDSEIDEVRAYATQLLGLITMHRRISDQSPEFRSKVKELFEALALTEERCGRTEQAGRILYGIAQDYRASKNWAEARSYFTRALETDPSYETRGYIFRERGGVFYELDELSLAEQDYRRAVKLGGSPEASFLLAILLFELGRYEEASVLASQETPEDLPEYYAIGVKVFRIVTEAFSSVVEISSQERREISDELLDGLEDSSVGSAELVEAMQSMDALDPRLWIRLSHASSDNAEQAFRYLLVAAWICVSNAQIWILAVCGAIACESEEVVLEIWKRARLFCPDLISVAEQALPTLPDEIRREMWNLVYIRSLDPLPRAPRVIRFICKEGFVEIDAESVFEFLHSEHFGT